MRRVPLLLVGDSPRRTTGLARIARDLATHLQADIDGHGLQVDFVQAGPDDGAGQHWTAWPFYGLSTASEDWGAGQLGEVWHAAFGDRAGVILTVWDPARVFYLRRARGLPAETRWWGYMPVDARTRRGAFGGPAAEAVRAYDRVLGYTRWGAEVLQAVTGRSIPYLPHGLFDSWGWPISAEAYAKGRTTLGHAVEDDRILLGCVAANQPRKDFGLYMEALAILRQRGWPIHGWLHTDLPIGVRETQWVVPQLLEETGLGRRVTVTQDLSDPELATLYALSTVTIAPGLGEGFGYPIVESLAAGTPVIHGTYGGGAELVPRAEWRVPERGSRLEGPYALVRPVYSPEDVANAVERAIRWRQAEPQIVAEYCKGAVAHLDWGRLWPKWRGWILQGLRDE